MSYNSYLKDLEQKTNPNGKRFTWNQMMDHRQRLANGERVEELEERPRHGICTKCGRGRFRLKVVDRELVRICKTASCLHETIV